MSVRQYIGARYVTKIYENSLDPSSAEWEQGTFEPLVMVTWQNSTYLSKKRVPGSVGDPANNPDYWVCTGYYNGQILQLQNDVAAIYANLTTLNYLNVFTTPQMYGAVGDGMTDDSQAFTDMFADSKFCFIPTGTYLLGSPVSIPSHGTVIFGAGIVNTILLCSGNGFVLNGMRNISIMNMSFKATTTGLKGLILNGTYGTQLENVYFYDFDTAISFETTFSWDAYFNHVRLNDCNTGISDTISGDITNFYCEDLYCDHCISAINAHTITATIRDSRFGIINADAITIDATSNVKFENVDFELDSAVSSGVILNFKGHRFEFHNCKFIYANSSGISYMIDPLGSNYMLFHNCIKSGNDAQFINVDNFSNNAGYGHLVFDSYLMNSVYDEIITNGTAGDALKVRNLDYNGMRTKKGSTYNTTYLKEGEFVFDPTNHTLHYFDGTNLNTVSQS